MRLYLPGLSPLLSFASLSVKPALLSIFEDYIAVLKPGTLQPALKAITLALLPGLEEEASEEFERTHRLLDKFRDAIREKRSNGEIPRDAAEDRLFWQSIFLATMTSSSRRQGSLQYLIRNLPRLSMPTEAHKDRNGTGQNGEASADVSWPVDIEAIISPEPGLLIRCFAAGLRDDQLLVQRGFLDLLVTHLPLSSPVLQLRVKQDDLELLISAAASVVARREMSLNRRLWSWFIGPESSKESEDDKPSSPGPSNKLQTIPSGLGSVPDYFESYGLHPLTESVLKMIATRSSAPLTRAKPFRICLSLMDRSEIGGLIIPRIFTPAMESIRQYEKVAPSKEAFLEVLRSAHVFFDGIQSRLIWSEIIRLLHSALNADRLGTPSLPVDVARTKVDLVWFITTKFNIREEEMLVSHMPAACLLILVCVCNIKGNIKDCASEESTEVVHLALKVTARLLEQLPERAFVMDDSQQHLMDGATAENDSGRSGEQISRSILQMYQEIKSENTIPYRKNDLATMLVQYASKILVLALEHPDQRHILEASLSIFAKVIRITSLEDSLDIEPILSKLSNDVGSDALAHGDKSAFSNTVGLLSTFELLSNVVPAQNWASNRQIRLVMNGLILNFWEFLSPSRPQHNVEAVRAFWRLHSISPNMQLVESSIATLMISHSDLDQDVNVTMEGARRFATLWTHSSSKLQTTSDRRANSTRTKKKPSRKSLGEFSDPELLARPLLLLLDSLCDTSNALFVFTVSWLQSLSSVQV